MIPTLVCEKEVFLSFGEIHVLSDNIAEVFVNQDVVICQECVEEYHEALDEIFDGPFGLVVNKVNQHQITEYAQACISMIGNLKAVAILNFQLDQALAPAKEAQNTESLDVRQFTNRESALDWLCEVLPVVQIA